MLLLFIGMILMNVQIGEDDLDSSEYGWNAAFFALLPLSLGTSVVASNNLGLLAMMIQTVTLVLLSVMIHFDMGDGQIPVILSLVVELIKYLLFVVIADENGEFDQFKLAPVPPEVAERNRKLEAALRKANNEYYEGKGGQTVHYFYGSREQDIRNGLNGAGYLA